MSENTENLVPEHLRQIRTVVEDIKQEVSDLMFPMSAFERDQSNIGFRLSNLQGAISQVQPSAASRHRRADKLEVRSQTVEGRLDRPESRLDRIESELKLTDA